MQQQVLQPLQLQELTFRDVQFDGAVFVGDVAQASANNSKYYVSIAESINRILTTRIGERVMRPEFGSLLYLLRDRDFDSEWRIKATRYIFEAINRWEPRVKFKRLRFTIDALTGKHTFALELDKGVAYA